MHYWQMASGVGALFAAGFWMASALVRVPDIMNTALTGPGSITNVIKRQAKLSAIGAAFASLSALAQTVTLLFPQP